MQTRLRPFLALALLAGDCALASAQPAQPPPGAVSSLAPGAGRDQGRSGGARGGLNPPAQTQGFTPPGPAVPVPPQVAIPRPAPEEYLQINAAIDAFIAADRSAAKPLLDQYHSIITVRPPRANPGIAPSINSSYLPQHQRNLDTIAAMNSDIGLLLMGDSITDGWRKTGKAVFDQAYAPLKAANFGIGGDTTQGVLWRLQNGEGAGFQPKAVMLLIGTNNSGSGTSAEIAEGVGAVVLQLRTSFPDAKILLLAIFPRNDAGKEIQKQLVAAANPIIAKLHDGQHVFYLDIGQKFLGPDGLVPRDIMADGLHPTAKGYQIWADAVKDQLAELMR
jgi:lysophospholipase L1-like esterase